MKDLQCLIAIVFLLAISLLLLSRTDDAESDTFGFEAIGTALAAFSGWQSDETMATTSSSSPLKIFVMVGQSNTEGHGYINKTNETDGTFLPGTLETLVATDPDNYAMLKTYDEGGNSIWTQRSDVFITYNDQYVEDIRPQWNKLGPLSAGFGMSDTEMGPELGFGWTIGDAVGDALGSSSSSKTDPSIMLLKVAWGGRSLAVNYRPPSSGETTGLYYEAMLANVYKTLANLESLVPNYKMERGYEIAGFAWHQGWNDGCDHNMTLEYEANLANLIRDVRTDLGVPDLPFSIGVSGMNGWHPDDPKRTALVDAQLAVADPEKYPEFAGTVASVETRDFFREVADSPGDQIYHWNNNCESYWLIGQAMGKAMLDLLSNQEKRNGNHKRNSWLRNFQETRTVG